jgi:hypothetical protein
MEFAKGFFFFTLALDKVAELFKEFNRIPFFNSGKANACPDLRHISG